MRGQAWEAILDAARAQGASLIAMSTHGRTGLSRLLLGSVAAQVLHRSPVPLFLVRSFEWAPPAAQPLPVGRIVIPVDEDVVSLGVLPQACTVAYLFGAKALLLHVSPSGEPTPEARLRLDEAAGQLASAGIPFDLLVRRGDPAGGILATCEGHADDLIAMSTHGRRGLQSLRHRSITEHVLHRTTSPMLVSRVA